MRNRPALIWGSCLGLYLVIACAGCRSVAQPPIRTNAPDIRRLHPAAGTALIRFQRIDEGVYKGSRPKTDADFEFLRSQGIRYIVNLKFFPWLNNIEKRRARRHGMIMLTGTIGAWTFQPSEKNVNAVLCLLRDKRYHPIYVHCDLGRDRAMLIVGLYEMYFNGKSKAEAWKEMQYYGFKDDWTLAGLKNYFEAHSQQPVNRFVPACPSANNPRNDRKLRTRTEGPISVDLEPWFSRIFHLPEDEFGDEAFLDDDGINPCDGALQ